MGQRHDFWSEQEAIHMINFVVQIPRDLLILLVPPYILVG